MPKEKQPVLALTMEQALKALQDLELIALGEERELSWHRVCTLLDHSLVEIVRPVISQGTQSALRVTEEGHRFMDGAPTSSVRQKF